MEEAVGMLLAQRAAVDALVNEFDDVPYLKRDRLQGFLGRFYKTIESPKGVTSRLLRRCR